MQFKGNGINMFGDRGGARHFHLGGSVLQQGELSMVCVGLSERDLKNFGGQCPPIAPPLFGDLLLPQIPPKL